jgi:hypothetical protein
MKPNGSQKKKRPGAESPLTQRERINWVMARYTELVDWVDAKNPLSEFEFPDQQTHAAAQVMLASEDNLKHFISQASQAEIRAEKKNRGEVRDDLRRNLSILKVLERNLVQAPPEMAGTPS